MHLLLFIKTNAPFIMRPFKQDKCINLNKMSESRQMVLKQKMLCLMRLLVFILKRSLTLGVI